MTAEGCRRWREQLGAYTVDRLDAGERAALEAHLGSCADCRAEAAALARLSRLLPLADPGRLDPAPAPPPALAARVFAAVGVERRERARRRRRRVGLSLAGAVAVAVSLLIVLGGGDGGSPSRLDGAAPQRVQLRPLPPGGAIAARLESHRSGTVIRVRVDGLRAGTLCRVFLRHRDGRRLAAGSFRYSSGAGDDAVLTSGLDLSQAEALVMVAGRWTYSARLR